MPVPHRIKWIPNQFKSVSEVLRCLALCCVISAVLRSSLLPLLCDSSSAPYCSVLRSSLLLHRNSSSAPYCSVCSSSVTAPYCSAAPCTCTCFLINIKILDLSFMCCKSVLKSDSHLESVYIHFIIQDSLHMMHIEGLSFLNSHSQQEILNENSVILMTLHGEIGYFSARGTICTQQ